MQFPKRVLTSIKKTIKRPSLPDLYDLVTNLEDEVKRYDKKPNEQTLDNIKNFVLRGHPVIVPIMGNILKNPYYPYPGYHMLTVIGFTEDKIITNDNGTRHGKNYPYDNEIFLEAMTAAGGDIVVIKTKTTSF